MPSERIDKIGYSIQWVYLYIIVHCIVFQGKPYPQKVPCLYFVSNTFLQGNNVHEFAFLQGNNACEFTFLQGNNVYKFTFSQCNNRSVFTF